MFWSLVIMILAGFVAFKYFDKSEKPGCSVISIIILLVVFFYMLNETDIVGATMVTLFVLGIIGIIAFIMILINK